MPEQEGEGSDSRRWSPIVVGIVFGVVLATITGQWYWLAIGIALGPAFVAADSNDRKPDE